MGREKDVTRLCALTREEKPAAALVRFAVSPDGVLAPDVDAKAPGRGVWITLSSDAVAEAVRKKVFARSLKENVTVPPDLAQQVRTRLEQRLAGALGLARKAGALATGAAKVAGLLEAGRAAALITASDAAPDGRRKMLQSARRGGNAETLAHIESLSSAQLGLALGLENVIHAALTPGAAANSAIERANRLALYIATDREEDGTI
ncbi:RNA-binding protein [Pelagibacterium sp. H642]|uniref:RNA-binding protein n=1 Tax=Pelagibacterium sp. H642 TaxID=1881069 RepID=UPI002815EE21|nr:RNA-binding protein [Pelagibacterium sp. H642]WMT92101.1 RNA-binding protein [Pelagibacterium sp. H642]